MRRDCRPQTWEHMGRVFQNHHEHGVDKEKENGGKNNEEETSSPQRIRISETGPNTTGTESPQETLRGPVTAHAAGLAAGAAGALEGEPQVAPSRAPFCSRGGHSGSWNTG